MGDVRYNFDEAVDRRHDPQSFSEKWSTDAAVAQSYGVTAITDEHIALSTADMDFRCAEPILDALRATVDHGIFGYSTLAGNSRYLRAIRNWFAARDGWDIDLDRIVFSNGSMAAVNRLVRTFTRPGDTVIVQTPAYPPFFSAVEGNGRKLAVNSLVPGKDLRYTVNFDEFETLAAEKRTRLFLLCNPQNPTGRVWEPEELARMAEICARHNVLIVADEIHGDLVRRNQRMRHIAEVVPDARVVTCTSIDKTFNLEGLATANLVFSSPDDQEKYLAAACTVDPSPFAISATIAAYEAGEDWLNQLLKYLDGTIDAALEIFAEQLPDVRVHRPEGTYMLWLDFERAARRRGLAPDDLHRLIYDEAKVILRDGSAFDPEHGAYFQRMCVATSRQLVSESCMRIARVLNG